MEFQRLLKLRVLGAKSLVFFEKFVRVVLNGVQNFPNISISTMLSSYIFTDFAGDFSEPGELLSPQAVQAKVESCA